MADKIIGRTLQPVVNMHRVYLAWPFLDTGQQQRAGIRTAAERDGHRQVGLESCKRL